MKDQKFKSRATVEFNRVSKKFEVIKDSQIIGIYTGFSMASYRAEQENSI